MVLCRILFLFQIIKFSNLFKMKKSIMIMLLFLTVSSCRKNESSSTITNSETSESTGVNGTYTYNDSSASLEVTVSGSSWTGKTIIKTGFGDAYDAEKAEYQNGIVKGTDLYDDSGYAKIGNVSGNSLNTSLSGRSVTLRK